MLQGTETALLELSDFHRDNFSGEKFNSGDTHRKRRFVIHSEIIFLVSFGGKFSIT